MQTYQQVSVPAASGLWSVNITPPQAIDPNFNASVPILVKVIATSATGSRLTAAGKAAIIAEFDSYLTSANLASQHLNAGALDDSIGCKLSGSHVELTVLPADASTVSAAIVADLQTAANVT